MPYAFGTIPNFGGRTTIGAKTHIWARAVHRVAGQAGQQAGRHGVHAGGGRARSGGVRAVQRTGLARASRWTAPRGSTATPTSATAARRGGPRRVRRAARPPHTRSPARTAARTTRVFAARPDLAARSGTVYATHTPAFDPADFDAAFAALLGVRARAARLRRLPPRPDRRGPAGAGQPVLELIGQLAGRLRPQGPGDVPVRWPRCGCKLMRLSRRRGRRAPAASCWGPGWRTPARAGASAAEAGPAGAHRPRADHHLGGPGHRRRRPSGQLRQPRLARA